MATDKTYFEQMYKGPYNGFDVSAPENMIPPEASPYFDNVYIYQNTLRNFPLYTKALSSPGAEDLSIGNVGKQIKALYAAKVLIGTLTGSNPQLGTFVLAADGLYVLRPYWRNNFTTAGPPVITDPVWKKLSTVFKGGLGSGLAFWPIIASEGTLYYSMPEALITHISDPPSNIVLASLYKFDYINGEVEILLDSTHQLAAQFIGELNGHLILANTLTGVIGGNSYAFETTRVRWSSSGDFTQFDPNANVGAGFNDLSETPDEITGLMLMGRNALIFRTNGITEMFPLGGINPFGFNHMWATDRGIGNVYPGSIANYGSLGAFIADDDIYMISTANFKPIAGRAKIQIYNDLETRTDDNSVVGSLIPILKSGHVHLMYVLTINQPTGNSIIWLYSVTGDYWMRKLAVSGIVSAPACVVPLGTVDVPSPNFAGGDPEIGPIDNVNRIAGIPVELDPFVTDVKQINMLDPDSPSEQVTTYNYRVEDFKEGKYPTISKVRIRYRDKFIVTQDITINIDGEDTPTVSFLAPLPGTNSGKIKTAYADIVVTTRAPQLSWSVQAGVYNVEIISMTLIGNLGDGPEL